MGAMNELIDISAVARLRARLGVVATSAFPALAGISAAQLAPLALRERSDLVTVALLADLPDGYTAPAAIIRSALADPSFEGWGIWPVTEAVATLAIASPGAADFDDGLALLAELTPRLTAEFAIRRFLAADLDRALPTILGWTTAPDPHVRRLASEGTRPFLPWAVRVAAVTARPDAAVPILDALRRDDSDYVRRSVANHLNDLARQNAGLVVDIAERWLGDADERSAWVVRHGLRTLVKRGDPGALALLGFTPTAVTVSPLELDATAVELPGSLGFSFAVTNESADVARIAVDYAVHYLKSNGTTSDKVFKLASATIAPGETVRFAKRHTFRQMTTRVHHAGLHMIEAQVNGARSGAAAFVLG
ncbi:MAG: DNA alkylation repair protein [Burkholderiaceae bacterium]|nr:DNA alkylation repair protein [Microbacteriaceae bacterium]